MLQKGAPIDWLQKQIGHRNLTMLIRHYWRLINPGELDHETLARLGAVKTLSTQPLPRPHPRQRRHLETGLTTMLNAKKRSNLADGAVLREQVSASNSPINSGKNREFLRF
jgi:hypothetical protein